MADTNTLDLSDLSSEPVESNVQAEISDAPAETEGAAEEVADESVADEVEADVAVEEPSAPSTEEVVETVQTILTTDAPSTNVATKTTEERLNALIELLKSGYHTVEYLNDDDIIDIREEYDMFSVSKKLNEL